MPSFVSCIYRCLNSVPVGSSNCTTSDCTKFILNYHEGTSTEDIEMRVCRDHSRSEEDIVIEDLEIYVQ